MKKTAIILTNLGTPDEPTTPAVRRYLREFLSDQRVIEIPTLIWQIILNLFVLTIRPKKVAHAYQSIWHNPIWGNDSPMRAILAQQSQQVAAQLHATKTDSMSHTTVHYAMTYGNPAILQLIPTLCQAGYERLIVLPLYPQYSATSTGAAFDKVAKMLMRERNVPELIFIKDYHNHPEYIACLAASVREFWAIHGRSDKLLMSFHGIPQACVDKGDPYEKQCRATAQLLADTLGLDEGQWAIAFQSRFGAQAWLQPYTDELLRQWGKAGVASVQVISPAFSADCLETLEELAVENQATFLTAGGQQYAYIPALNVRDDHIRMISSLLRDYL